MICDAKHTVLELCAGGGGQALGLEWAGFSCVGAVEIDGHACQTLRHNRPHWNVIEKDIRQVSGNDFRGVDLLAGGVPCPPFSIAGKQLGSKDERDLFPEALRLVEECKPRAVLLENVSGFASAKFESYRRSFFIKLSRLGYEVDARILNACEYGVSQLRPRLAIIALRKKDFANFVWPIPERAPPTVGQVLFDLMGENNWPGALSWARNANRIAPTIVGGSKKHGGPDLGPTRAKREWRNLGVDGLGIANEAPDEDFPKNGIPRLTVRMVARLQSFPDAWFFSGGKTAAYRQVGNAFPPAVPCAVGLAIVRALEGKVPCYEDGRPMQPMRLLERRLPWGKANQKKLAQKS